MNKIDTMTDFLKGLDPKVTCMDGDCTVRYYNRDGGLALGIIRTNRVRKEGKVPQDVVTINSMDLNNLIGYIMATHSLPVNMGDLIVNTIKSDAMVLVHTHLHDHSAHTE
jgi:hypothetical protein